MRRQTNPITDDPTYTGRQGVLAGDKYSNRSRTSGGRRMDTAYKTIDNEIEVERPVGMSPEEIFKENCYTLIKQGRAAEIITYVTDGEEKVGLQKYQDYVTARVEWARDVFKKAKRNNNLNLPDTSALPGIRKELSDLMKEYSHSTNGGSPCTGNSKPYLGCHGVLGQANIDQ